MLIINEINTFNISFHGNTLISGIDTLTDNHSKKYNFIGIQAINLFLIEYFNLKQKRRAAGITELTIEESYHAILLHINNLVGAFYNIHIEVGKSKIESKFKEELFELLKYTYYTKFNYFFVFLKKQHLQLDINFQINYLLDHYKIPPLSE